MVGVATYLLKHIPRKEVVRHTEETFAPFEELRSLARLHRKDIVVEVEKLLVEPLDAVQMHLDRVAVEGWQKLGRDNILVEYDMHLLTIYPLGHLTLVRNHEMYLANKRHILGYTTEEVTQSAPVTKTLLQHRLVGMLLVVALPHRVQAIYVCNNYIHRSNFFQQQSTLHYYKGSVLNRFIK